MNFTNTDCFWNGEVINIKVIDQVCRGVYGIELITRVPLAYLETPSVWIRWTILKEIWR